MTENQESSLALFGTDSEEDSSSSDFDLVIGNDEQEQQGNQNSNQPNEGETNNQIESDESDLSDDSSDLGENVDDEFTITENSYFLSSSVPNLGVTDQNKIFFARESSLVTFQPQEFTSDNYTEEYSQNKKDLSGYVVRWRKSKNGGKIESNARIVTWSDGSRQLLIGSESIDIMELDVKNSHNQCFVRNDRVLHYQSNLDKRMYFQPVGINSTVHKNFSKNLKKRTSKGASKIKIYVNDKDPEKEKEKEIYKHSKNYENKLRKERNKKSSKTQLTSEYLEQSDGYDEDSSYDEDLN
ncbi:leo1 protein [Anaeramoeba flamelloides]|uniref:Leo1 protein n=1 Tax=Anaeramoeba flamelloides TaxID=1746091 RepID=A0AAV8A3B2_9EUKA|nr:leo1 protein [Anaeramoeba flamelloides]